MPDHRVSQIDYRKYLNKYWILLGQKKVLFVVVSLLIMTCAVVISYLLPKKYEARSVVFIEQSVVAELMRGMAVAPSVQAKIRVLTVAMQSRPLLMQVIQDLDLDLNRTEEQVELLLAQLRGSTRIDIEEYDGLFIVSFSDTDPRLARDYVNILVRRYLEEHLASGRDESSVATLFIAEQIDTYRQRLDETEAKILALHQEKGHLLTQDAADVRTVIAEAQEQLEQLHMRRSQFEAQSSVAMMDSLLAFESADPLESRLSSLESRLDELLLRYGEYYPEVIKIKREMERLREHMAQNPAPEPKVQDTPPLFGPNMFDIQLAGLQASEQRLRQQVLQYEQILQAIPQARAEMDSLIRERDQHARIYEELATRHGYSELSKQMELQDKAATFRIVESAVLPLLPSSPNRPLIIFAGILFGVAMAFGLIFLLDFLDRSIRDVDTLKHLGLPVLAVIPLKKNEQLAAQMRRRDKKLFLAAGAYFCVILAFLAMELLGVELMDKWIETLQIRPMIDNWILQLKQIYWSILR
jgi:polysaccharide chain length determinant protein (PEP-CTERM system associated)